MSKNNFTQKTMAQMFSVSESQLNRWLKKRVKPSRLWTAEMNDIINAYEFEANYENPDTLK